MLKWYMLRYTVARSKDTLSAEHKGFTERIFRVAASTLRRQLFQRQTTRPTQG